MTLKEMNKSKICAQPWFGVTIKPNGVAGICCEITDELTDMNVVTHTFAEMQQHPRIIKIKNEMLAGIEPEECWRCFEKEKSGARSLRHTLNTAYEEFNGDFDPELVAPQNIEIVLGNLCQLQCVMCHPSRSKKIENVHNFIKVTDMRSSFEGFIDGSLHPSFNTDWVEDDDVWQKIASQCEQGKRFFINGGEPMLARKHFAVLQKLIDNNVSKHAMLTYSSNGMLITEKHMQMWSNFKNVSVSFSVDDLADRNGFIRYPSDWGQVTAALDRVVEWQKRPEYSTIEFGIWCAINMVSLPHLPEYVEFFATKYPTIKINGWRAVQTPPYLNPSNVPFKKDAINEIVEMLSKYESFSTKNPHLLPDILSINETECDPKLLEDGIAFLQMNADFYRIDWRKLFPKFFNRP